MRVDGLAAAITIANGDVSDLITINSQAGDDVIDASRLISGVNLAVNAGLGDDVVTEAPAAIGFWASWATMCCAAAAPAICCSAAEVMTC